MRWRAAPGHADTTGSQPPAYQVRRNSEPTGLPLAQLSLTTKG